MIDDEEQRRDSFDRRDRFLGRINAAVLVVALILLALLVVAVTR